MPILGRMAKAKNPGVGRGKGGGPKTDTGKVKASRNSTKHGVLAKNTIILPGESQAEYEEVYFGWWNEYEPEGYAEERLVKLLITNDWFLRRAIRKLEEAEAAVFGREENPQEWSEAEQAHLQCMQRYKTAAERAFYRSLNAVLGFRKDRMWMVDKFAKARDENCDLRAKTRELEWELAKRERTTQPNEVPGTAQAKTAAELLFPEYPMRRSRASRNIEVVASTIEL
ncbi:MAG: hypothetical protein JOY54_03480 [Acidobacteriaceae bacterium]|nr:hypothetical protein [Acidobacteriaceae bacterium]